METETDFAFGRTSSGPPLRPKASGFMHNMVQGISRLEQRATGNRRKKFEAKQLPPGKDIFHGFEFPQAPAPATKTAGRKPYNWTPKRSRELIRFIIHSDLKFDDISTAMKDEDGNGPSETTCRNHWHEIFGYSPDMARLKYGKGRERRFKEHVDAFDAHRKKMKTLEALTVAAELRAHSASRATRLSEVSSFMEQPRTPSVYADSGVQVDDEAVHNKHTLDETTDIPQDLPHTRDFFVKPAVPSENFANNAANFDTYGLRPGLSTVEEDSESPEHGARPLSPNPAPSEISPDDVQEDPQEHKFAKPAGKTVADIEEKEGLPSGFIGWFRKISLGSTTDSRHPSTASYASRTSLRFSRSVRNSVATSISMGYHQERVPKDAICKYLGNTSALVEPSVGYVEELILRGADVNAGNGRGETPLHFAVGRGAIVICTILLQNGADAEAKSHAGETIWQFGKRISQSTLNPNTTYEKTEGLLRTMVAARIEFLRATVQFNPDMIVEEPERAKRRRNSDQNAWSRSGAVGASSAGRKKSKMLPPASASPKPARSPSTSQPTPEPSSATPESREASNEPTPLAEAHPSFTQLQYSTQTTEPVQPAQPYNGPGNEASYFPDPSSFPLYDNYTNFTQPFPADTVDPLYTNLPVGFFEGQEIQVDSQSFDPIGLASEFQQEDTTTLHASQSMSYMSADLSSVQQQYAQSSPPVQQNYAQPSHSIQQQQYSHPSPPVQQYSQPSPPVQQQYSHPSPSCPAGTVSPAQLSIAASPHHLSVSPSPGQYFSDYPSQSERGNSNASSIDPVVVSAQPTYTLAMDQTMQGAAPCLPHDSQTYNGGFSMAAQYATPEQLWAAYQLHRGQSQQWGQGGYSR